MKTKRLREAGLVLPQSGYEISNEEMMYVDGGFWRSLFIGIGVAIAVTVAVVATGGAAGAVLFVAKGAKVAAGVTKGVTIVAKPAATAGTAFGTASSAMHFNS